MAVMFVRAVAMVLMSVLVTACGSRRGAPTTPVTEAPTVTVDAPGSPSMAGAPAVSAEERAPTLATAGAEVCRLEAAISMGRTTWPRMPRAAFQPSGGIVTWIDDQKRTKLVIQRVSVDGAPNGSAVTTDLPKQAWLRGLIATDQDFLLLLRAQGGGDDDELWLARVDLRGAITKGPHKVAEVPFADNGVTLLWHDGAARLHHEQANKSRMGRIDPETLDVDFIATKDGATPAIQGQRIHASIDRETDARNVNTYRFERRLRSGTGLRLHGHRLELPIALVDLYPTSKNNGVVIEDEVISNIPTVAWNGARFFTVTTRKVDQGYAVELLPVACK